MVEGNINEVSVLFIAKQASSTSPNTHCRRQCIVLFLLSN